MLKKHLSLQLDFHSGLPIYLQIINQIQSQLLNGVLKPGDQLPTVRALAAELRVNFNTVSRAYRLLDEERIISTQQGRGTYIIHIPPKEINEKIRQDTLKNLAERYITEAFRLGFSTHEIGQMVNEHLLPYQDQSKS